MKEAQYNINDLEKLTGIKAHTIRIWEKRYNLLERTGTNIRYYTGDDLKKLLNISILNKNGLKISHIAQLSENDISEKVIEFTTRSSDMEDQIQALTMAMFHLNIQKFEKILTVSYINRGFEHTYTDILVPFLHKVGFLWQAGTINPAQEHFATNIIKNKIIIAIEGIISRINEKSKKYVLFLPEGEQHDIILLFAYYLLKKMNHQVIYLGASVPFTSLMENNSFLQTDYLVTSLTSSISVSRVNEYINQLANHFAEKKILLIGPQLNVIESTLPENTILIRNIQDFYNIDEY
jgi:DNA-binding transcriptional MerR regulator